MSRLQITNMAGEVLGGPFLRAASPTEENEEYAWNFLRAGGSSSTIARRFDVSGAGSTTQVTVTTFYVRLTFRCNRFPLAETAIWSCLITGEGSPAACVTVGPTGLVRLFNQGNQSSLNQPLGDCGTIELGDWNTILLKVQTRNDGAGRLPVFEIIREADNGDDGELLVTLPVPGSATGLQFNGGLIYAEQVFMVQSGLVATGDFDFADWTSDTTPYIEGDYGRVTTVKVGADGAYQEFATSGIADWRARNMWPYAIGTTSITTYGRRGNAVGARQSYIFQPMSEVGITGGIIGASVSWFFGPGGTAAHTLIIRRNGVETTVVLWSTAQNTWQNYRLDTTGWLATDTIEIGIQNASATGCTIGPMMLTVEHDTPYVAPTNTDFACALMTWTGNGTVQTIEFPDGMRPNFVWWWPDTDAASGGYWHHAMDASQRIGSTSISGPTRAEFIFDGTVAHLVGNEAGGVNVSGRVYRALVIADATRRMLQGQAIYQNSNANYDGRAFTTSTREGTAWQPTFAFGVAQTPSTASNALSRSIGNTGDQSSFTWLSSLAIANWFESFTASGFTLGNAWSATSPSAIVAMRSSFIGGAFLSMSTYVGDGTAARDITLEMPGYTPQWIYVQPTGTSGSTRIMVTPDSTVGRNVEGGAVVASTFLTRGVNRMTVGLALNASGTTYFVFAVAEGTDSEPEPEPDPDPYPGDPLPDPGPVGSTLNATLLTMRRLRRFTVPSESEFRVFFHRLELWMETGVGISGSEVVGSAPQVMLRWSDDGGKTWGNEHWVSAGRVGHYGMRVLFNRLGYSYDRVFEMVVSDPVAWRFVEAYIQLVPGRS